MACCAAGERWPLAQACCQGAGRKRLLDRWIEVQIKFDPKLYYAPQQGVFQHTSYVVIDTKDTNEYVHFVAALSEFLQEIAMLPQLCHESFQMCINGRR